MADQLSASPSRALDWTGDIVPGARLTTYVSGTTTLVTVFQDLAGTIPHTNPVLADEQGVFPQMFYTGSVKAIATDPDGVVLPGYPMDPLARSITSTSAASSIGFEPSSEIPETDVQAAIDRVQQNFTTELGTGVGFLTRGTADEPLRTRVISGDGLSVTVSNGNGDATFPTIATVKPTEVEARAGLNANAALTPLSLRQALSAVNAAPVFACRAWVQFDGATGGVRANGNIASVIKNATGDFTITFITAMPTANYAVVGSGAGVVNHPVTAVAVHSGTAPTTSAVRVISGITGGMGSNGDIREPFMVSVAIFC